MYVITGIVSHLICNWGSHPTRLISALTRNETQGTPNMIHDIWVNGEDQSTLVICEGEWQLEGCAETSFLKTWKIKTDHPAFHMVGTVRMLLHPCHAVHCSEHSCSLFGNATSHRSQFVSIGLALREIVWTDLYQPRVLKDEEQDVTAFLL